MSLNAIADPPVAGKKFSDDLKQLREERIEFNRKVLKLPRKKAEEWADRDVRIIAESEIEHRKSA